MVSKTIGKDHLFQKKGTSTVLFPKGVAKVQIPVYLGVYTHTPPAGGRNEADGRSVQNVTMASE